MATIQSGRGRIELFEDFLGPEWILAETAASGALGPFRVVGEGVADGTVGITVDEGTAGAVLNGVGVFKTGGSGKDATSLVTALCLDVALMAPLILEARVLFADADTKNAYMGLSSANTDVLTIEDDTVTTSNSTTIATNATHACGFYFSDELADDQDWHAIHKGGTATTVTVAADIDLDADLVEDEWQILRLEVDANGTARWLVDGVLKKTLVGAVATTANLAAVLGVGTTSANEFMYVDYFYVSANRDWTV